MKVDAHIEYQTLADVPTLARAAEELGFDGAWVSETSHDPFLAAALAAEHTRRLSIGTSVAIAFARSPTVLAHTAWDLAAYSGGRFILGLGSQVKAHVTRRFGMPWDPPAPKLRETVEAIRSVWTAWREGTPLNFRGRFYALTLMTPFFSPPRHDEPIPIVTAGVNPPMCRIAGAVADGFQVHPLHTAAYLRDVVRPAIAAGRSASRRDGLPFSVAVSVFAVSGSDGAGIAAARERVRRAVAFYASTPSYRGVLAHHGWEATGERLSALAARGQWAEMPAQVTDEMLDLIAVEGPEESIGSRIVGRYQELADRIGIYEPFTPDREPLWRSLLRAAKSS